MGRWQLQASAATRRGPRGLRGQVDLDALAHILRSLEEILHKAKAIWDIRWFPEPDDPDHLEIQEPETGPTRDLAADAKYPFLLRVRRSFRVYAVLLAVAYYFVMPGVAVFGNVSEPNAAFLALVAFGTVLLYGVVFPMFLAVPISHVAEQRRQQRQSALTRHSESLWPQVTSSRVSNHLQFSLGALLMVVTAMSVLLGIGCWIGWWRCLALTQFGLFVGHFAVTGAPFVLILPGMPLPNRKVVGIWTLSLGALLILHVLATILGVEMLLRTPMLMDLHPFTHMIQGTLNWTVPYVAMGLLIAGFLWQQVRSNRACVAGCGLAAVGLAGCVWYGHRFWCEYLGYDLSELSEIVWWV